MNLFELNPEQLLDLKLQADYKAVKDSFFSMSIDEYLAIKLKSVLLKRAGRIHNPDLA